VPAQPAIHLRAPKVFHFQLPDADASCLIRGSSIFQISLAAAACFSLPMPFGLRCFALLASPVSIENYTGWSVASRRQKANTSNETNRMKWNRNKAKRRQTKANRIFIAFISESIEKFTALKFYLERFASFIQRGASCWLFLRFPGVFPAIS